MLELFFTILAADIAAYLLIPVIQGLLKKKQPKKRVRKRVGASIIPLRKAD